MPAEVFPNRLLHLRADALALIEMLRFERLGELGQTIDAVLLEQTTGRLGPGTFDSCQLKYGLWRAFVPLAELSAGAGVKVLSNDAGDGLGNAGDLRQPALPPHSRCRTRPIPKSIRHFTGQNGNKPVRAYVRID